MSKSFIQANAQSILKDGDTSVITLSITRSDKKRFHYYFFKIEDKLENNKYIPISFDLMIKENGKGMNRHYNIVAVYNDGYVVFSLNKNHKIEFNYGEPYRVGLPFDEAEEIVKF